MTRLLFPVPTVLVLLTALTAAAMLVGRSQPQPNPLDHLGVTVCANKFCVNDIQPQITGWQETQALLGISGTDETTVSYSSFEVDYWRSADSRTNVAIHAASAPLFSLGDLLITYDAPCSLTMTAESILVQYPQFVATIPIPYYIDQMKHTLMSPRAPVTSLSFPAYLPCDTPLSTPSSRNIYLRWCGFRSLGDYIEQCRLPGLILLPE